MEWYQFVGVVVAIVVPVGLAIHTAGRLRAERDAKRLDDHIAACLLQHERQVRNETVTERLEKEVDDLRKDRHDFKDENKRATYDLMTDRLDRFRDEVRQIIREMK